MEEINKYKKYSKDAKLLLDYLNEEDPYNRRELLAQIQKLLWKLKIRFGRCIFNMKDCLDYFTIDEAEHNIRLGLNIWFAPYCLRWYYIFIPKTYLHLLKKEPLYWTGYDWINRIHDNEQVVLPHLFKFDSLINFNYAHNSTKRRIYKWKKRPYY